MSLLTSYIPIVLIFVLVYFFFFKAGKFKNKNIFSRQAEAVDRTVQHMDRLQQFMDSHEVTCNRIAKSLESIDQKLDRRDISD